VSKITGGDVWHAYWDLFAGTQEGDMKRPFIIFAALGAILLILAFGLSPAQTHRNRARITYHQDGDL
jgi:hypothetical protein